MDKHSHTIGILGAGNMGGAIAAALASDTTWKVSVYNTDPAKSRALQEQYPTLDIARTTESLVKTSSIVLLAVKPQVLPALYADLRKYALPETNWISIAAGVSLSTLTEQLASRNVIRFMPNMAATVKASVTAVCPAPDAPQTFIDDAKTLAEAFGEAFIMKESDMPAFIGISGSAIAYHLQFLHNLAMAGTHQGIPYSTALALSQVTAHGAIELLKNTGRNPMELAVSVCSAGGTTIEGMKALAENGFESAVYQAVAATAEKSRTMEILARLPAGAEK